MFGKVYALWVSRDQAETGARVREAEQVLEEALRRASHSSLADSRDFGTAAPDAHGHTQGQDDKQLRLGLSELWAVTHRRLDHYHGIALGQARQSFRNAQIAMGLGFGLLTAFVIVALNASTTAGSVVAGGLGAVSAALAGYVSRTFIRSQEAAAGHLRAYFDQPLEFSRYLAAERLIADAALDEEKRAEILSQLVQAMLVGPTATTPAAPTEQQAGPSS
ncbi:TRADD-N-associated membrane domain-containing protein [Streptomyces flaveolus]|uniref:TRADD-N-associated membrane domain-containing protein n=1 Tax=Streptomyces flaveolus TaxID=67297 RepID=UPI0037016980